MFRFRASKRFWAVGFIFLFALVGAWFNWQAFAGMTASLALAFCIVIVIRFRHISHSLTYDAQFIPTIPPASMRKGQIVFSNAYYECRITQKGSIQFFSHTGKPIIRGLTYYSEIDAAITSGLERV